MKAVNLIPQDLRRASGTAGATGPAVYVLLGVLGVLVVMVAAWALAGRSVAQGRNDLQKVEAETAAAEVRAGELAPYAKFASMREKRVETVTSLSRSRFNWPFALREISRVLPSNVWLTQVTGTVAPGVPIEDAPSAGNTAQLRNALSSPAVELIGCTTSQEAVARYLARLRSVQGVTRVSLAQTEKADISDKLKSSGGGSNTQGGDCRAGDGDVPQFALVIFFESSTATRSSGSGAASTTTPASDSKGTSK